MKKQKSIDKKIVNIIIFLLTIMTLILAIIIAKPFSKAEDKNVLEFSGGSGTEEDPYQISNATDIENLAKKHKVYSIKAMEEAEKIGNVKAFNVIVLGLAAKHMDFDKETWLSVIEKTVPPKTVDINKKAFLLGFDGGENA